MTFGERLAFVMVRSAWMTHARRGPQSQPDIFPRLVNAEIRLEGRVKPTDEEASAIFRVCAD